MCGKGNAIEAAVQVWPAVSSSRLLSFRHHSQSFGASLRAVPSVSLSCPSIPRLPFLLPNLSSEKSAFHTLSTCTSRPLTVLVHFNCFGDVFFFAKGKIARRVKRPMIAEKNSLQLLVRDSEYRAVMLLPLYHINLPCDAEATEDSGVADAGSVDKAVLAKQELERHVARSTLALAAQPPVHHEWAEAVECQLRGTQHEAAAFRSPAAVQCGLLCFAQVAPCTGLARLEH